MPKLRTYIFANFDLFQRQLYPGVFPVLACGIKLGPEQPRGDIEGARKHHTEYGFVPNNSDIAPYDDSSFSLRR